MSIIITILFFGILPLILGQIWKGVVGENGFIFVYSSGFLTILALFELLGVPMVFKFVPLHVQVPIYSAVFIGLSIIILMWKRRDIKKIISIPSKIKTYFSSFRKYDWIYFIIFMGLLLMQVYFALFYDIGEWRSDDGVYTVISSSAIHDDGFYLTSFASGEYTRTVYVKYGLCSIYAFYTYAAVITGLGVSIIEHTLCCALFLMMAYGAFYLLAKTLLPKEDGRDNRFIFLILLSFIYLFGMYSHYSLTFRLFGVIWQGKAFLAVFILPFLLATYPKFLREIFHIRNLLFFVVVSLATISLTMGGILIITLIPILLTLFYIVETKKWKTIFYLLPIEFFPMINAIIYLIKN